LEHAVEGKECIVMQRLGRYIRYLAKKYGREVPSEAKVTGIFYVVLRADNKAATSALGDISPIDVLTALQYLSDEKRKQETPTIAS
jgi:hypothetical protein